MESASVADSCTLGSSKAPQNGRKPYQFKPGNPYAWKPGQSGNPSGRPYSDAQRLVASFGCQRHAKTDKTRDEHAFEVLYRRLCQGDMQAAKLWLAYRFGNPPQGLEHSGGIDLREALREARERARARAGVPDVFLPAPTDAPGAKQTARATTATPEQDPAREDDAEQPVRPKIRVEPWAN